MKIIEEIGKELKHKRLLCGLTQLELADIYNKTEPLDMQIHRITISNYERCITRAPADAYVKLLRLLDKMLSTL